MTIAQFYNECYGESYDHGAKLVSVTDLKGAAVLTSRFNKNEHLAHIHAGRYVDWGLGIDWGGGGISGLSKTAIAIGGLRADGIVEVFYGHRSDTPNDFVGEAQKVTSLSTLQREIRRDGLAVGRRQIEKRLSNTIGNSRTSNIPNALLPNRKRRRCDYDSDRLRTRRGIPHPDQQGAIVSSSLSFDSG
jgi:hypothetical protein